MTIIANMAASLNAKRNIDQLDNNPFDEFVRNRGRSGRTGSLALPNNSLLDFYDTQQEQCNSASLLLPPSNSNVIRRHSSHCCPMLDETQQQQQQQQHYQQQSIKSNKNHFDTNTHQKQINKRSTAGLSSSSTIGTTTEIIVVPPPPPIPKRTFKGKFSNREQIEHHQQNKQQKRERIRGSSNSGRYRIDGESSQESQYCNIEQTIQHQQHQPKPIKQSFDQTNFNYTINNSSETSIVNKPILSTLFYNNKDKQIENKLLSSQSINNRNNINKKQVINPTTNIMSKRQYQLSSNKNQHNNYDTINNYEQNIHHNINDDDDEDDEINGIVDDCDDCDDGLENSVFDEPTRTVNCFNNVDRNIISSSTLLNHHQQQIPNNNTIINNDFGVVGSMAVTSTTTKLPSTTSTMNNSRHSNRSSSDSNKSQITIDTGYISSNGSEKNLTSVESRISGNIGNGGGNNGGNNSGNNGSGNTNNDFRSRFSSVDTQSSLDSCLTEKTIDSPLSKESFRIDSGRSSSAAITTTNNFDYNNYDLSSSIGNNTTNNVNYNNKIQSNNKNCSTIILPVVPMRKQFKNNNSNNMNSNSSNNRNRPIPPTPPFRSQHSIDSINCQIINQNNVIDNNDDNGKKLMKFNQQQQQQGSSNPSISFRNKFSTKNRPPPIVYHPKLHQRQDSSISSDSFSMTSSPGYNSKSMEVPLIQQHTTTTRMTKNDKNHSENDIIVNYDNNKFGLRNQQSQQKQYPSTRATLRQDSTISNDSFSQTSSPSYNTKNMESPLLPSMKKYINTKQSFKIPNDTIQEHQDSQSIPSSPIIKSTSTPASLQTVVRFQNGTSNMSLQHRIINRRKSSVPYVKDGRLKFRLLQILINALALLAIAGGLVAYFNAYPTIKFINKTIITPIQIADTTDILTDKNPAPGICLPIIVKFCQTAHVPYNYTVFPNYIGHFGQLETQVDLESYDALVDVRCYELVSLFLCTLFVPKCGSTGTTVPPCKSLCTETMRRCGFFFDVFSLSLPDYLNCNLFTDHMNPEECVGNQQVKEVREESINPTCNGFLCDQTRCIPNDWRCDGHVDCLDQTDESNCEFCDENSIYCGEKRCMSQKHMCDGTIDCPYGQDERSCIRLSERNGDIGKGFLEIYKIQDNDTQWVPACITNWDTTFSPPAICSMLGYNSVTQHQLLKLGTGSNITTTTLLSAQRYSPDMYRKYQKGKTNFIKEFSKCPTTGNYPVVELTCNNYECGKIRNKRYKQSKRIVGGHASNPGDWPFLAAILGGPEEIFYCAGVLIGDQWVLTASHCIGNHTLRDINDWTIQLGVTRRNSHTYYGQKVKVINVIPHPQYNTEIAHDNDIALFQLAKRVAFHEHLLPVCLPPPNLTELKAGTYCTVIGWGKREDKNLNKHYSSSPTSASYELSVNEVKVPVVKREICDEWLESSNITDGMICAGYADGGKDACQGDSGGPLLCPYPGERDKWFVGGIVSWGILCAHPKLPGVYANVPKYIPWIKNEISKYSKINNNHNNNNNNYNNDYNNNNKKFIDNNYYNNKQNNYNNIKYNNNVETDDYN